MDWNQLLLKLLTLKNKILLWESCIHPSMDLTDFDSNYLNKLLENISKEQKSIFLIGDFNVNLLNYCSGRIGKTEFYQLKCIVKQ